ncbi:MAG: uncharacterized membrane protein YgdD (TMEM256/DUF423 family) [Planctomycetota bacterium]|jgi:uncharacterized membrane protein YgdD (TMEM256/DUF423 family)
MGLNWLSIGAISGFLAVGAGAFGAHSLKDIATPEQLEWWGTAAEYHLMHSLALLAFGLFRSTRESVTQTAGYAYLFGMLVFSGTLYAMALGAPKWFGAITPIGGVALMVGWIAFARAARR